MQWLSEELTPVYLSYLNNTQCERKYALPLAVKLTDCLRMFQQSTPDFWLRVNTNPPKSGSMWTLDLWLRWTWFGQGYSVLTYTLCDLTPFCTPPPCFWASISACIFASISCIFFNCKDKNTSDVHYHPNCVQWCSDFAACFFV